MYRHRVAVETGPWYRVDSASGSSTPVSVLQPDGVTAVGNAFGSSGSTVKASTPRGNTEFYSATQVLYLKRLTYKGALSGDTPITSTGADLTIPSGPTSPSDVAAILAGLPTTYAQDAGPAEGQALYVYGHSYTVSPPYYGTTGREWPVLLKNRLKSAAITQYGQSGSRMWEVWLDALSGSSASTTGSVWPSTRKGLVVLDCETNDMRAQTSVAGGVTGASEFFEECLRGFLAATRSIRIESDAATLAGTWGTSVYTHASGGQAQAASVLGSSATFSSVTIPSGVTTAYVVLYSGTSRGYSIEVDGAVVKTGVGITLPTLSTASRQTATPPSPFPYTIPIPVTPGSHTVKVTSTTASFTLDALLIPVANPAPVVIVKDPAPVTTGGSFSYTAPGLAVMAQGKAELDAVIDRLAVEFSNVVTVNPAITASDFSTVDNLHLNDRGHRKFAAAVAAAARTVPDSLGLYAVL
jgi:hypothetical protein